MPIVFTWPMAGAIVALAVLGWAANLPYFPESSGPFLQHPADSWVAWLNRLHALAMLGFSAAALWQVAQGWRDDLVASVLRADTWDSSLCSRGGQERRLVRRLR